LDRIEARAKANVLLSMSYDAAGNGHRVKGMKGPATDADAASLGSRRVLRQRSRELIRNAPFARRAMTVVTNNVVGDGILPTITGPNKSAASKRAAKAAAEVILPHLQSAELDAHRALNLSAMQTVVCNSLFESGELLVLRRTRSDAPDGVLPLAIELLEIDHLDSTVQSYRESGVDHEVIDGIEYDTGGVAIAYHLFEKHPGSVARSWRLKSNRVPASDVLHIRRNDRPGQMRGVPWMAPVMVTLAEMRDYQEAQILKQKISSLLVGVVEAGDGGIPKDAQGLEKMAPGGLVYTEAGQKVVFTDPPQVNDYDVVMRLGLCAVAMGIGITYESLAGDLGRVNFSSARIGRLEMDKNIETWQTQILIGQFCASVGRWALEAYRLTQGAPRRGLQMSWTAQRRAIIDPTKEIPAIIKKVTGGLSSMQREQRAMGLDPEVIAREREEDEARSPAPTGDPPKPKEGNSS